jgi:ATP-dependent RNA circularization protein (DNA/RNA ligase family)
MFRFNPRGAHAINWLRVSRTGQICPYTFDKLGLFMSFAAV